MTTAEISIPQGRKVQQVLDGARAVFVAHGYERASMDENSRARRAYPRQPCTATSPINANCSPRCIARKCCGWPIRR